jgi:hypothetical protein
MAVTIAEIAEKHNPAFLRRAAAAPLHHELISLALEVGRRQQHAALLADEQRVAHRLALQPVQNECQKRGLEKLSVDQELLSCRHPSDARSAGPSLGNCVQTHAGRGIAGKPAVNAGLDAVHEQDAQLVPVPVGAVHQYGECALRPLSFWHLDQRKLGSE